MAAGQGAYMAPNIQALVAGEDLSSYKNMFVKFGTDGSLVMKAGANEKSCGVLMNAPTSGQIAEVARPGGGAMLKISETVTPNKLLTPTSGSLGEVCDASDEWCGAIAQSDGVANDIIPVQVAAFYASVTDA